MAIEQEAPSFPKDKEKALDMALAQIDKDFGKGAIFNMGKRVGVQMPHIPTGVFSVDYDVLGIGGFPKGRINEIYGPEAGGKTTMALQTIASAQSAGEQAAFIDAEHALDPNYATKLGVDMNKLLVSQPDCGEPALEIAEILVRSGSVGLLVVDSVAALVPRAELEGEMGDSNVGLQARLMSQAMRKLTGVVAKSNTCLIFINQIREKIGVMFGSPETTTGGRALRFYSSVRLDVRRIAQVKEGDLIVGNRVKVKGAKNKVSPPFQEAEIDLMFGLGFEPKADLIDNAVKYEIVEKSGAWFSYKGERLGQGRLNAAAALEDAALYQKILKEVLAKRG